MAEEKKFLDQAGVQYLWSKLSLEDYPNNQDLVAIINAIDETKADKDYVDEIFNTYLLNIDYNAVLGFNTSEIVFDINNNTSVLGKAILG